MNIWLFKKTANGNQVSCSEEYASLMELTRRNKGEFQVHKNVLFGLHTYAPNRLPFSSVQSRHSVMPDSLQTHGLQHVRPPCLSPTPRVYSNSCTLSQSCYPTISSSVISFSSCLQNFQASGIFPMSQFFTSSGQELELQLQHQSFQWIFMVDFLLDWLVWSPCSPKGLSKSLLQYHSSKAAIFWRSAFLMDQLSHSYMTVGKTISLTYTDLCWQNDGSAF